MSRCACHVSNASLPKRLHQVELLLGGRRLARLPRPVQHVVELLLGGRRGRAFGGRRVLPHRQCLLGVCALLGASEVVATEQEETCDLLAANVAANALAADAVTVAPLNWLAEPPDASIGCR